MANSRQVLDKISRDLAQLGIANTRGSANEVIVANGSNQLTVSYVAASIQLPLGGVDGAVSPFLGIGIANPGKLKLKSSSTAADSIADVIDSTTAAQILANMAGHANDIVLENSDATYSQLIRAHADMRDMGM